MAIVTAAIEIAQDETAASSEAAIVGTAMGDDGSSRTFGKGGNGSVDMDVDMDIDMDVDDSNHPSGGLMDVSNHPQRQRRFPGNNPDDSNTETRTKTNASNRHYNRQHVTCRGKSGGVSKKKKEVLLLRHRHRHRRRCMNEQQQQQHEQQQRKRKLHEQHQHHPSRTNTRRVNNDDDNNDDDNNDDDTDNDVEDSTKHVLQDEETERIPENNVDNDPSMPPPNQEMTNFVLLQRQNRVVSGPGVPTFGGLVALQEEQDNDPTQTTGTSPTSITGSALSHYNPDAYRFTNLPDGTPVYSSLSQFCSKCSIAGNDGDNKINTTTAVRNYIDDDGDDVAQSLSTSQRSIDDNHQKGIVFVGKSSIVPLAQSSYVVTSTQEEGAFENKATINDSTGDRYYDSSGHYEDVHQNDENVAMSDSENVVDDCGFASSSIVSPSSSSTSSIAITTDSNPEDGNGCVYEVHTLHHEKKKNIENYPTPDSKKQCNDDDLLDAKGLVSEEDASPPPREESSSTNTTSSAHGNRNRNTNTNTTRFKDIIGHQSVKLRLDEILLPLALPASLSRTILKGVRSLPASILMYGPPGCGKTQLAKAIAGEAHAAFLSIGPSDILSKYVGESEEAVRSVFAEAVRLARNNTSNSNGGAGGGNPCTVLFFDEIDALGQSRGAGSSNNNGNGTMGGGKPGGSEQSGGGDNSSRRILAELLIQLTKVNTIHGTYDFATDCDEEENDNYEESRLDWREKEEEQKDGNFFSSDNTSATVSCEDEMLLGERGKMTRRHKQNNNSMDDDNDNRTVRVIVVAATNRPEDCDPALIRRFAVQAQVGLPKAKDRKKMLKKSMVDIEHTITKKQFSDLSLITDGWSGSDLQSLAREAAMAPVRECIRRAALLKRRRLFSRGMRGKNKNNIGIEEENRNQSESENESESNSNAYQCQKESNARDHDDSFTGAQKRLLEEFRNLRPVNFRDYTKALAFWFGRMYDNLYDSPLAEFGWIEEIGGNHDANNDNGHAGGSGSLNEHYDSSSDEDEEEEALSIEGDPIEVTGINRDTERMGQHWDFVV